MASNRAALARALLCDCGMQLSRFVLEVPDVRPGEHVLYSVLHDRYVGLDDQALAAVRRWSAGAPPARGAEAATAAALHDEGFLVDAREEDDDGLRAFLLQAQRGEPGTLRVTVQPTLQCNLACGYCFQKDSPAFDKMSRATEDATVAWILRTFDARALDAVHVHWFGGEPLTRKDAILRSMAALSAALRARGARLSWSMTTNGVLLDAEFCRALSAFGDGVVKVTLDGDRATHDAARTYRDGRGSFDRIFENVRACAPLVRIQLGANLASGQEASVRALLARLEREGVARLLQGVSFKPVMGEGCAHAGESVPAQALVQLGTAAARAGVRNAERPAALPQSPCELHWEHSYTVDPAGRVYKCPAVAGRPEMAVGDVRALDDPRPAPLTADAPWTACGACAFLPVCLGGCLAEEYLRTGRTGAIACRKPQLERLARADVARRYLDELADAGWETASP